MRPGPHFDTLRIDLPPAEAKKVRAAADAKRIDLRAYPDGIGVSLDETTSWVTSAAGSAKRFGSNVNERKPFM